jgi:hypothetical protein
LTPKKGGRLEKLIEGTFGSTTAEEVVEVKKSLRESCIELKEDYSLIRRKKRKPINPHEKGAQSDSYYPEQCATYTFSTGDINQSLREKPIKDKAVQVNISTQMLRQQPLPAVASQAPKLLAPLQISDDGKFQNVTVLACEQLPYRTCLTSQHCWQQQSQQQSIGISAQSTCDCDKNVHRDKALTLSPRGSNSVKGVGMYLPLKQSESNVEKPSVHSSAMHLKVMESMSNAVAKPISKELDGQWGKPDQLEVGSPAENSGVKAHKGHESKKKKLNRHKMKEGSVSSAQVVQLTASCKKTGDESKGPPNLEQPVRKSSGLLLPLRIKVKGPQRKEPNSNMAATAADHHDVPKDNNAQNLMSASGGAARSMMSSGIDEQSSRNRNVLLEEQYLKDNSVQVAASRGPGRPKKQQTASQEEGQHVRSSILGAAETKCTSDLLTSLGRGASKADGSIHVEQQQQKPGLLDTDLPSDDRCDAFPPNEGGGGGEEHERGPGS